MGGRGHGRLRGGAGSLPPGDLRWVTGSAGWAVSAGVADDGLASVAAFPDGSVLVAGSRGPPSAFLVHEPGETSRTRALPPLPDLAQYAEVKRWGVNNVSLCLECWDPERFEAV